MHLSGITAEMRSGARIFPFAGEPLPLFVPSFRFPFYGAGEGI